MKRLLTLALAFLLLAGTAAAQQATAAQDDTPTTVAYVFPKVDDIRLIDQKEVEKMLATHGKDLLVVNFWATWCAPCVAELPYFEQAHKDFRERGVQLVGYTMDYLAYIEGWQPLTRRTVDRLELTFPQFALNVDTSVTVPFFSPNWYGELPATYYYTRDGRKLGERIEPLEKEELYADIEKYLAMAQALKRGENVAAETGTE